MRQPSAVRATSAEDPIGDELARFFNGSLDLLCIAELDGYFKLLNPAWTTHLGWSLDELLARPLLDFVHPDDRAATRAEIERLAGGADTIVFENRYRRLDGSYRSLQWSARSGAGGRRIYATARDVTHRKRLDREILGVIDREQERLARELHDGLCQTLAGIAALAEALSRRMAESSEPAASAGAAEIFELLEGAISEARGLARGLGPAALGETGLDGALETLAKNVERQFRSSCTLECDRPFPRLRREVETHLFRIAQEAVRNALTHGGAKRIVISLGRHGAGGRLSVLDDGMGPSEQTPDADGVGMHTMAFRAHAIGGSLELRRSRRGMLVRCSFPLPKTPRANKLPDEERDDA